MIETGPIGFWNTGFPLALLGGLAVVLPRLLVSGATRSQRVVAIAILLASLLLLVAGAVVFAVIYAASGVSVWAALAEAPLATAWFLLGQSLVAAVVWGPVLALVWFGMAQGVERRKGEDVANAGSKKK